MNILKRKLNCLALSGLLGLAGTATATEFLQAHIKNMALIIPKQPSVQMSFEWAGQNQHLMAGYLDIGLGSNYSDHFISEQSPKLLLKIVPKQKDAEIHVRQRSVTYLNVSGEGPHVAIKAADAASRWVALKPQGKFVFAVLEQTPKKLNMDKKQILKAVREEEPDWVDIAKTCTSENEGACYTVTDTEFEITVKKNNATVSKGNVKVLYPNGC